MTERHRPRRAGPKRLREAIDSRLRPLDLARARSWLQDLVEACREVGQGDACKSILADEGLGGFLAAIMDHSRFLRHLMLDDPARLLRLLSTEPEIALNAVCKAAGRSWREPSQDAVMARLRHCRAELALLVAIADLGRVWESDRAMAALSAFADAAISAAASAALRTEHQLGHIRLPDPERPQQGCGWILLAMGKLGANELNFSSDVDLIALFDPTAPAISAGAEPAKLFVRLTRSLIKILQERTEDDYVLRTDLRLRPDPALTAVAVSVPAALLYYETLGQNWERAAMIKARPVAGDIAAGESFLAELAPFIWRKYLDYAAIADIHSIKRQIHDHRGHAAIAIAGHNLKLGRGGIREIEFFVQTQQLIAGGRNLALRGRATLDMLLALAREGWVDAGTAEQLADAYRFFRDTEHRLQMINDEQTHTLPDEPAELKRLALLLGMTTVGQLEQQLRRLLETTQRRYSRLFEEAPALSATIGNLVFTGDEDDPDTLRTLEEKGFADPALVSGLVRGWHFGRYPATRSTTARERLAEVTPALLDALAKDSGDSAVLAFDRFLSRTPAGVQLFSLIGSNAWLLSLLADILGAAPRLADIITRRPHVLDAIIEPAFFGELPDSKLLAAHLRQTMDQATSYEEALDRARIFGQEQSLLIGARILAGSIDARRAGAAFTDLADLLIGEALRLSQEALEAGHGKMPGGRVALLAMGKLGGGEMSATSDLDLILLYDFSKKATGSDGDRALTGSQYYTRLTQRLVAALAAPTAEGSLYQVDFRLRPSGNSGPVATSIDSFTAYQTDDAWTWEHMSLTRARLIAGDGGLIRAAKATIGKVLSEPRQAKRLSDDVLEMRSVIEEEKGGGSPWDIKLAPGGLVDIEFIAQYLQLRHASKHPELLAIGTETSLSAASEAGLLSATRAEILLPALRLYQSLIQIIRLCVEEPFRPDDAPDGLKALLARAGEMPDFYRLEAILADTQMAVRSVFEGVIGEVVTTPGR